MIIKWQHPLESPYRGPVTVAHNQEKEIGDALLARQLLSRYPAPSIIPDEFPNDANHLIGWFTMVGETMVGETMDEELVEDEIYCQAITKYGGKRCKNKALPGSIFCGTHQPNKEEE